MLKEKIEKFVPTELKYDSSTLDEREKIVVEKLYLASKIMDELFLDQVYRWARCSSLIGRLASLKAKRGRSGR